MIVPSAYLKYSYCLQSQINSFLDFLRFRHCFYKKSKWPRERKKMKYFETGKKVPKYTTFAIPTCLEEHQATF